MKRFQIRHLILVACLVSTAYAEHRLAVWIGWNEVIAWVIPGVADLYLIHATQKRKDMVPAVLAVVTLCALSYSVTMPLDWVKTSISIGVSSLAPLVLWRLHVTHDHKMEMLWGKETAQAVHRERDNGWSYEFIPADFPRSLPGVPDVPAPPTEESGEEQATVPVKMKRTQALKAAEDGYAYGRSASEVAKETGYSYPQVRRWYKAFEKDGVRQLVTT